MKARVLLWLLFSSALGITLAVVASMLPVAPEPYASVTDLAPSRPMPPIYWNAAGTDL